MANAPSTRKRPRPGVKGRNGRKPVAKSKSGAPKTGDQVYVTTITPFPIYSTTGAPNPGDVDEAVQDAMNTRFPPDLLHDWAPIVFSGGLSQDQLRDEVNTEVHARKAATVTADLSITAPKVVDNIIVSPDDGWSPGGGGYHESRAAAQAIIKNTSTGATTAQNWQFRIKVNSIWHNVSVAFTVGWHLEDVET